MRRGRLKCDLGWRTRVRGTRPLLAILFLVVLSGPPASGQDARTDQTDGGKTISLERVRQLREDVDLWPLIVNPRTTAEKRVNGTLTRLNEELANRLRDCLSGKFAWSKESFNGGEWERTIKVAMKGPRFLSMVATDGFYCGGAHPEDDLTVVVFDLQTGTQLDWTALVTKSAGASSAKSVPGDDGGTPPLMLPALQAIYAAAEENYCKDFFAEEQPFFLWPDAGSGTLTAEVAGLPHVAVPCKNELKLTIEQARKLGFDESLLQAIEEAHRIAASRPHARPMRKLSAPTAATHRDAH